MGNGPTHKRTARVCRSVRDIIRGMLDSCIVDDEIKLNKSHIDHLVPGKAMDE
jgi:hypothetical protein